jgi:hypothetical protein
MQPATEKHAPVEDVDEEDPEDGSFEEETISLDEVGGFVEVIYDLLFLSTLCAVLGRSSYV